jgi:hypothetical protein
VPVVGECLLKVETAHHDKRQVIHESRRAGLALTIAVPGGSPVINGWKDQSAANFEAGAQGVDLEAERRPCGGVATLRENVTRGHDRRASGLDLLERA